MSEIIKEYLDRIKTEKPQYYFLLYRFYLNPNKVLGGNDENTMEQYYKYGDIKSLILNNTFFEFLYLCFCETQFNDKLDYNLLRKIRFILFDSKELKDNYSEILEDKHLRDFCNNKVPLGKEYSEKYNLWQLGTILDCYKRFGWIFELNINTKHVVNKLDINLVNKLISVSTNKLDIYYELYIKPIEDAKLILDCIKNDNYSNPDSCILYYKNGYNITIFNSLVCNNEFLKVARNNLFTQELHNNIIDNIITILEIGIDFKTLNMNYENFWFLYTKLGKEKIKEFDYKDASELIMLFQNKKKSHKKCKILPLIEIK